VTRFGGNWAAFVELAHSTDGDDEAWAERLARAATAHFPGAVTTWVARQTHEGRAATLATDFARASEPAFRHAFDVAKGVIQDERLFRAFYFPPHIATTHTEIERHVHPEVAAMSRGLRQQLGIGDMLGLITHPLKGEVLMMGAFVNRPTALSAAERIALTRAGLHIEAAYRLRKRPESVRAILDANGRVLERFGEVPELDGMRGLSAQSIDLWPALVAGRLSLVPRGTGKSRRLFLVENDRPAQGFRALGQREADVLRLATRGLSTKVMAYALGLSPARVSQALALASAKVGTATNLELVRLGALLTRDPRLEAPAARLTSSEREVLDLLQQGLSNEVIAKMRARSVRTIANQVAALLRKTGTSSRRELAARTE
jgi:DNA-binding NarL/FixJ family response regulator